MTSAKGRILCIEDDPDTRDLIAFVLTDHGFQIVCTHSTDEALQLAKTQDFDLFLVDNWMPGLSGPDLTRKLREFNLTTPVLFYSAAAFESDKEAAREAGAQGYLVKPVLEDDLIKEVARLIAEARIAHPLKVVVP
jgi:CheY-like chemotaxis protein